MATNKVNLPPGFQLESPAQAGTPISNTPAPSAINLPQGFVLESQPPTQPQTSGIALLPSHQSTLPAVTASTPPPQAEQSKPMHLPTDFVFDLQTGALKSLGSTLLGADNLVRHVLNKVTGAKYEDVGPQDFGLNPDALDQTNLGEKVGGAIETVLEFLGGDAAIKSLSIGQKLKTLGSMAKVLEEHPKLAVLAAHGLDSARAALVGGGQELVRTGGDVGEAAKSGTVVGALGLGSSLLGEGIKAFMPEAKTIGAEVIPILASQGEEAGVAVKAAQSVADSGMIGNKLMGKFAKTQAETAKAALGGVAEGSKQSVLDALTPEVKPVLAKVKSFGEAAEQIQAETKPVFEAINKATGGEYDALQSQRTIASKAIRRADSFDKIQEAITKKAEIDEQINSLFNKYAVDSGKSTELTAARAAYRHASAMEDLQDIIDKATRGVSDNGAGKTLGSNLYPERISGTILENGLRKMDPKRLLDAVGGNQQQVQNLHDLAAIMKSNPAITKNASKVLRFFEGSSLFGLYFHPAAATGIATVEGTSAIMSLIMTSPRATKALYQGLAQSQAPAAIADLITQGLKQDKGIPETDSAAEYGGVTRNPSDVLSGKQ
jgi:hypothetical protein